MFQEKEQPDSSHITHTPLTPVSLLKSNKPLASLGLVSGFSFPRSHPPPPFPPVEKGYEEARELTGGRMVSLPTRHAKIFVRQYVKR